MGKLSKKAGWTAGVVLLLIGGGSITAARIHHQQEWKQAFRAALDSGERAFDYREAGSLTYNSRLQTFEVAYDALRRMDPPGEVDSTKAANLGKCLDDLKQYRTNQTMWSSIRGLEHAVYSQDLSKQASHQQNVDSQELAKTAENCFIELER